MSIQLNIMLVLLINSFTSPTYQLHHQSYWPFASSFALGIKSRSRADEYRARLSRENKCSTRRRCKYLFRRRLSLEANFHFDCIFPIEWNSTKRGGGRRETHSQFVSLCPQRPSLNLGNLGPL